MGRLAVEVHFDAELLRSRLLEWDFDSETARIDELRKSIGQKARVLSQSLLGTLSFALQVCSSCGTAAL